MLPGDLFQENIVQERHISCAACFDGYWWLEKSAIPAAASSGSGKRTPFPVMVPFMDSDLAWQVPMVRKSDSGNKSS